MDGSCLSSDKITVVFPAPRNPVNTVIEEVRFDMIVKRIESRPVVMVTLSAWEWLGYTFILGRVNLKILSQPTISWNISTGVMLFRVGCVHIDEASYRQADFLPFKGYLYVILIL